MYDLIITGPAERDILAAHEWWRRHRSEEQADRWFEGIRAAVQSLRDMPERCPLAAESELCAEGIRQHQFGSGRRATHRILFALEGDTVVVLRVRHTSQGSLTLDDLD